MINPQTRVRLTKPTDRLMPQTRKVQNWWRDQTLSDVNLHESSRGISAWLATPMKFSSLTGEAKETSHQHTSTVWGRSQQNYKETTKTNQLTWRVRDLSVCREIDNNGRIRLTWHSKQQKERQGKYSQLWSLTPMKTDISPDGKCP